jgi:hypothetical protein
LKQKNFAKSGKKNRPKLVDRMNELIQTKKEKIDAQKKAKLEMEKSKLENYSFQPKINKNKRYSSATKKRTIDDLYQWNKAKNRKNVDKLTEKGSENTFGPKISKKSKELAEKNNMPNVKVHERLMNHHKKKQKWIK